MSDPAEQGEQVDVDYWTTCREAGCRVRLVRREAPRGLCFEHLNERVRLLEQRDRENLDSILRAHDRLEAAAQREKGLREALELIADDQAGGINVEMAQAALAASPPNDPKGGE